MTGGKAAKESQDGRAMFEAAKAQDPRSSALDKVEVHTQAIEKGLRCPKHGKACYLKYNGICGTYTPDNT